MRFRHTELENGLTVIGEENPNAESMAAGYFVRTGSRDETPDIAGVSHFLEHMMFKGTERRTAEDVNREFDELGAQYNAFTSEENTVYFGRVLPEFQARLLDLLTDMMRPSLREEDFEVEKKVILEEIARYEDIPPVVAYEAARERFYNGHPLGHSVLGTTESIRNLPRDRMLAYFERRYSPTNMTLVLTGRFDWEAALEQVGEATAGWTPFDAPRDVTPPDHVRTTAVRRNDKLNRAHLIWMVPGPSRQDERRYAASVLATAVGDDVGSRFYWALVDRGLVDEASLSLHTEDHAGAYVAYVCCEPDRVGRIAEIVREILVEVTRDGLKEEEITRAKQKIASGQVLQSETPMGRLLPVGMAWVYRHEYRDLDTTIDRLIAVDGEEVRETLAAYPLEDPFLYATGPFDRIE